MDDRAAMVAVVVMVVVGLMGGSAAIKRALSLVERMYVQSGPAPSTPTSESGEAVTPRARSV